MNPSFWNLPMAGPEVYRPPLAIAITPPPVTFDVAFAVTPEMQEQSQQLADQMQALTAQEDNRMILSGYMAMSCMTLLGLWLWDLELWPEWALRSPSLYSALVNYLAKAVDAAVQPTWAEQIQALIGWADERMIQAMLLPAEVLYGDRKSNRERVLEELRQHFERGSLGFPPAGGPND